MARCSCVKVGCCKLRMREGGMAILECDEKMKKRDEKEEKKYT